MAGKDNVVYNTLERALSTDQNNEQSINDRSDLDMLREIMGVRTFSVGAFPVDVPRDVVLGGFEVTPSGVDVAIAPGVLMQNSLTIVPVPGPLDSSYRIGINRSSTTQAMPAPAGTAWYVIEAQVFDFISLSENRDIYNPGLNAFISTPVTKQIEKRVQFQLVDGVPFAPQAPAPSGGDWVPIAVVRRPGGGGPVLASDIFDIRPMWNSRAPRCNETGVNGIFDRGEITLHTAGLAANTVYLSAEAYALSERLYFRNPSGIIPQNTPYGEAGLALAADTWYYLYLGRWRNSNAIVGVQTATSSGKGLLVLSAVAPNADLRNSAPITPAAPWGISAIPADGMVCVGAVRRNAANTDWVRQWSKGQGEFGIQAITMPSPPLAADNVVDVATFVPASAKSVRLMVSVTTALNTGAVEAQLRLPLPSTVVLASAISNFTAAGDQFSFECDLPLSVGTAFNLHFVTTVPDGSASVSVIGWGE